jgi:cytochrome c-type biogenesis protein CcmH
MITLLIFIVTFLLLMLAIIWRPFFRANADKDNSDNDRQLRDQTNIQLYQEHKREIEQDFNQAAIDEENYQYLLTELDKSLLQDMAANEKEATKIAAISNNNKLSLLWPLAITSFVLIFSIALYQKDGSYAQLSQPQTAMNNADFDENQQALAQVEQIKQALAKTPKNSELWYSLGQANIGIGDFDGAVKAFDQVISIEGKKAELLGAKAQAVYYRNDQKIDDEVQQLIDQALALDAHDPSTNVLLGMDNFVQQNYKQAIHYWQSIIDSGRENINSDALNGAINEAKNRLALLNNPETANGNSPKLTLNISLSEAFKQTIAQADDKAIFVYAIPSTGERMPLAAMKIKTSDLPITLTLTNAQAMSPQYTLATADKVNIYAVISQQGSAGIKSGDYQAELKNIAVNTTKPLDLVINKLIP